MATHININGTWVANSNIYTNINGSWVTCISKYININGSWVKTDPPDPVLINIQDAYNAGKMGYYGITTGNHDGLVLSTLNSNLIKVYSTQQDNLGVISMYYPYCRYIKFSFRSDNIYGNGGDSAIGCTVSYVNTNGVLDHYTFSIYEDRSFYGYPANTGYSVITKNAGTLFDSRHWYTTGYHVSRVSSSAVHSYDFVFSLANRTFTISSTENGVVHTVNLPSDFQAINAIDAYIYAWYSSSCSKDSQVSNVYVLQ